MAPSLVDVSHSSQLGKLSPRVDYSNIHFGSCGDNPGTTRYKPLAAAAKESTAVAPAYMVTEYGYDSRYQPTEDKTIYGRPCAIPDRWIQAYDVRGIFEWELLGANRVYFYQTADMSSDAIFGGTGLIKPDGTVKPQYTAIKT